jgi:outer membrane lipoprotein SlyB
MKNLIVILAAILAVGISGCASKKAETCKDGTSCCAKKK